MTWLIAEDEADIRNLIALMCQVWGHTPLAFENGQKVWDWLDAFEGGQQSQIPELVLMDIRMPGKKGNEIAQRMRTIPQLQQTPIVLMTAFSLNERERDDMIHADGVDRILSKPLPDFDELRGILDGIIAQKKEASAAAPTPDAVTHENKETEATLEQAPSATAALHAEDEKTLPSPAQKADQT